MLSSVAADLTVLTFRIHGVPVRFETHSELFVEPAAMLMRYFVAEPGDDRSDEFPLVMRIESVATVEAIPFYVPADGQVLYQHAGDAVGDQLRQRWQCCIVQKEADLYVDFGAQGRIVVHADQDQAVGYIVRPEAMHVGILESYVHFMLMELLRCRGLYSMHATALEKNGWGVLIPGYSGRGKTTSFLSLLRSGYKYLSDDHPLLRMNNGRVELCSFPLKVDVTENTINFFPELRNASSTVLHQGPQKRYFWVEDIYSGVAIGERCRPAVVLFPNVVDADRSWLEPLSKTRVLEELLPQGLVVYDKVVARKQFQVLAALASQVECYRLHFGRDRERLPELIDPLLHRSQS
ncbi:MAG: hypothetical protein U0172_05195 [Nitrospiraceae bacterium]